MHFSRTCIKSCTLRNLFKSFSSVQKNVPIVKVLSTKEDDCIKVTFQYATPQPITVKVPKDQSVQSALSLIKGKIEFQRKKEELIRKYSPATANIIRYEKGELNVHLMQNDSLLDINTPNSDAWIQASYLKIGDILYEVKYNTPRVTKLTLPDLIISGCTIRPHFNFECAYLGDSIFKWYRSITQNQANQLVKQGENSEVHVEDGNYWLKLKEGFLYTSSSEDIGCFLRLVCTPRLEELEGPEYTVQSSTVVEASPETFPFEERQRNINSFCDNNSIRCVSYNVLASQYLMDRNNKFPYVSEKAKDICYRKQILLKELPGYRSDVICLQEVEEWLFEYDLVPALSPLGYTGFYTRKGGHRREGPATFVRSSKFRIKRSYGILLNKIIKEKEIFTDLLCKVAGNYRDMSKLLALDTALQVLILENTDFPENKLIVANTHLYANKDSPEVRLIQAAVCTHYIEYVLKEKTLQSNPVLFCGDFNSLPNSSTFDFITSGTYECCPSWKDNSESDTDSVLSHNLCLDSACGTPEYTNYTEEFQGCLDYIFYSKNFLKVTDVVPMSKHEDVIADVALPNEYFPSDHIALVCTLQWNNS